MPPDRIRRIGLTLLRWLVIAYVTYIAALYFLQRDFIYHPMKDDISSNETVYTLKRDDGVTLRGWVINPGRDKAILYFGGNAERLSYTIDVAKKLFSDYTVYLVHYRGFGDSEGEPTEQNLLADALALYDDIKPHHKSITVIGRSLGSAVANYVASQREVDKVVLITPFDSIEHIAEQNYPGVPVSLLLKDKFESWKFAQHIKARTLVLIADHDRIVPRRFTDNLLRYFKKGLVTAQKLDGTGHVTISHHPEYYLQIARFLDEHG